MRQTDRQREDNALLHKDKDLSTSRLFYKSVPDEQIQQHSIPQTRIQITAAN